MKPIKKILIVEDDSFIARDTKMRVENLGYNVSGIVPSGEEAIEKVDLAPPDLILMDIKLKGQIDGVEAAKQINTKYNIPIVYVTAFADKDLLERVKTTGPYGYITKPFKEAELHTGIEIALYKHAMEMKLLESHERLKENEEKYRALFERESDAIFIYDPETTNILDVNNATSKMYGYSHDELIGMSCLNLSAEVKESVSTIDRIRKDNEVNIPYRLHRMKDETVFPVDVSGYAITLKGKKVMYAVIKDITKRKQIEEKLKKSENKFRNYVETSQDLIWECDSKGRFVYLNPAWEQAVGYKLNEMLGKPFTDFTIEDEIERNSAEFVKHLEGGFVKSFPSTYLSKDGSKVYLIFNAIPLFDSDKNIVGTQGSAYDITENKRTEEEKRILEAQLQQAQKTETIGTLAGGIAHDFNNILFPIVGFAEMLEEDLAGDKRFQEYITEILSGAKRAKELVKQILTFSRQTNQEVLPLQPHLIVNEVIKLIHSTIPSTIQIRQKIDKSSHTILADPTQIHQVAMNLATNAFHAMEESGGTLTIVLENIDISEGSLKFSSLDPGSYVLFSVEDTGAGMESHIMEKIFNPYFTTKPKGKGTGLGLSVVHGIVTNYGGDIFVSSTRNKGTTFKVLIPAVENEPGTNHENAPADAPRGTGNIMLVDDEPPILMLEEKILSRLGYDTDAFSKSEEALARIQSHPHAYDLVITDMTMPKLTGDRLILGIKKVNPDLPVILCTGFSGKISPESVEAIGGQGLLYKPVVRTDLARTVAQVLGTARAKR